MKKASTFLAVVLLVMLTACGGKTRDQQLQEEAKLAAETYYGYLLNGQPEAFLNGRYGKDSLLLPESYRKQLVNSLKQFVDDQNKNHGGLVKAVATSAKNDSVLQLMQVYMNLVFADSTMEEVVVPMIKVDNTWKMK